jgi:hypothetical protein
MMYLCANGMQHTWRPTGRLWAMWASAGTSASFRPANAPIAREEVCQVCGAVQHAPANPEAKRYSLEAAA